MEAYHTEISLLNDINIPAFLAKNLDGNKNIDDKMGKLESIYIAENWF